MWWCCCSFSSSQNTGLSDVTQALDLERRALLSTERQTILQSCRLVLNIERNKSLIRDLLLNKTHWAIRVQKSQLTIYDAICYVASVSHTHTHTHKHYVSHYWYVTDQVVEAYAVILYVGSLDLCSSRVPWVWNLCHIMIDFRAGAKWGYSPSQSFEGVQRGDIIHCKSDCMGGLAVFVRVSYNSFSPGWLTCVIPWFAFSVIFLLT